MKYQPHWRRLRTQDGVLRMATNKVSRQKDSQHRRLPGLQDRFREEHPSSVPTRSFILLPSLLPPLELAATSKAYCHVESLLPRRELTVASKARCRLKSLLPPHEPLATSRACFRC